MKVQHEPRHPTLSRQRRIDYRDFPDRSNRTFGWLAVMRFINTFFARYGKGYTVRNALREAWRTARGIY